ncbi:unnamed protein product, partial [Chrysoparadoxa australica]
HCGLVKFEIDAPGQLHALESPSRLRYPFIRLPAANFRLTSEESYGALYLTKSSEEEPSKLEGSVRDSSSRSSVAAHYFCRKCGVHVFQAPSFPLATTANVNVHCLDKDTIDSLDFHFLESRQGSPGHGSAICSFDQLSGLGEKPLVGIEDLKDRVTVCIGATSEQTQEAGGGAEQPGGQDGVEQKTKAPPACKRDRTAALALKRQPSFGKLLQVLCKEKDRAHRMPHTSFSNKTSYAQ